MVSYDPSLLIKEGNNLPKIWKMTLQRLLFTYPHLRSKPDAMLRQLEQAQKDGAIPEMFEGKLLKVPSIRWVNMALADSRPKDVEHEKVYFPESFRSQTTTKWEQSYQRTVREDGTSEWIETSKEVEAILPPRLPHEAISAAMHCIKVFNEKGFERPTVRLVENFYLILVGMSPSERNKVGVQNLGLMAALILSYGDTTHNPEEENSVWRYIEGWLAYEGYRQEDTQQVLTWREAQVQREQKLPFGLKADYNEPKREGILGATMDEGGTPRRRSVVPSAAVTKSFPYPEMIRKVKNSEGELIDMAFHHPANKAASADEMTKNLVASFEGLDMPNPFSFNLAPQPKSTKEDSRTAYQQLKEDNPEVLNDAIP